MSEDESYSSEVPEPDLRERVRGTPVEDLFELADLDGEIAKLQSEMKKNQEDIQLYDAELARVRKDFESCQHALKEAQRAVGREEGEVATLTEQRKKLDDRMMKLSSPKEIRAIEEQISKIAATIAGHEEKLLTLYEQQESASQAVEVMGAKIEQIQKAAHTKTNQKRTRNAAAALEITHCQEKKGMYLARLEPETRARYEKALAKHGGVVIYAVDENACGGCGWSGSATELNKLRQNPGKPFNCTNCGRLIVWVGARSH